MMHRRSSLQKTKHSDIERTHQLDTVSKNLTYREGSRVEHLRRWGEREKTPRKTKEDDTGKVPVMVMNLSENKVTDGRQRQT